MRCGASVSKLRGCLRALFAAARLGGSLEVEEKWAEASGTLLPPLTPEQTGRQPGIGCAEILSGGGGRRYKKYCHGAVNLLRKVAGRRVEEQ